MEFNGSSRHFFGKPQDHIFKLIDKIGNISKILKTKDDPFRESIINHIMSVVHKIRESLYQRNATLEHFFPKQKNDVLGKHQKNDDPKKFRNVKEWTATAITFTFVLVHKLSIEESEVNKLIYMFRMENSQKVDLNVIQKWVQRDAFVEQYFEYYLVGDPTLYQLKDKNKT